MGESLLTKQALRIFRGEVDQRIKILLQHYPLCCMRSPTRRNFQLPPPRPALMPGESDEQYAQRVAQGFLRRAAVLRRDISAYFCYAYQLDRQAIFTFVSLAPRLTLQEPWVYDQLLSWLDAGEEQFLRKLLGLYKGKRSPQHQVEQRVLYGLIHAAVDYLCEQRGIPIQSALAYLAQQPIEFTLDGTRHSVSLSQSSLQGMYYDRGPYERFRDRAWELFYQVYEIAEQVANPSGLSNPLSRASARYYRLYGFPPIS